MYKWPWAANRRLGASGPSCIMFVHNKKQFKQIQAKNKNKKTFN